MPNHRLPTATTPARWVCQAVDQQQQQQEMSPHPMPQEDWADPNVLSKAATRKAVRRTVDTYNRAVMKPKLPAGTQKRGMAQRVVNIAGSSFLLCLVVFGNKAIGQACGMMGLPLEDVDRLIYFLISFGLVSAVLPNSLEM